MSKPAEAGTRRVRARRHLASSRLIVFLAIVGLGVTLGCATLGYGFARQSDARLADERREALRTGIAEFRALFSASREVDPRFVRLLEQSAGLKDVKFETEPVGEGREMQPVIDAQGRIAGFLTWRQDTPMTAAFENAVPLVATLAFVLVAFAGISLRQLRRARFALAASEAEARRAAQEDPLTGLPNRAHMLSVLGDALAQRKDDEIVSFGLIELDGLSGVAAQHGLHGAEDVVALASRHLRDALPANVIIGRAGENGFAVIAPGAHDQQQLLGDAVNAAARPHWLDSVVHIGAHGGYAFAPRDAVSAGELARRAELALRAAGKPGAVVAFEQALDATAAQQQFIRRELPRALAAGALNLHYQPIVTAEGARIIGVEALLRWNHPERGPIGPAQFIPVAEQMGLMDELGAFVLRRAAGEARRWENLTIAVNLSPLQVRDRGIVDLVREVLAESGLRASRLMLEVTEGVLIDNPEDMIKRIEELHALGVKMALDDFGSGYSSLGYLQRFTFDQLKIDRSFVTVLGRSPNAGVIIQAIVALGRALNMSVLVEGVETEEQRVLLRMAGCDEMQGFLFARPMPAKDIDALLRKQKPAPRAA